MDILVDLIIYIIRTVAKSRQPQQRVAPPNQQDVDRQKAEVEKRIREMQSALTQRTAAGRAPAKQLPRGQRAVKPTSVPLPIPAISAPKWNITQTNDAAATSTDSSRRTAASRPRQRIIVPLLIGEILAPPLALRELEL